MAIPWDDPAQRIKALHEQARLAQEARQFSEAAELFRQSYELQASAFAAGRYVHCLRRQGAAQARAAVRFAREPVERWPLDSWLIREYVWAIYDGYLRQATEGHAEEESAEPERPGFDIRLKAARRILKLSREELPRARAVFAICREAKARREWELVLEFAMGLDPQTLSDEAREYQGRSIPSDRQQWLSLVTRAYLELEQYDQCLQYAHEGRERYPHIMFYAWWHALALVRQGQVEAGLRELEQVQRQYMAPWYVRRDIADACERLQRDADAWAWYCAVALGHGELKSRVSMLSRMAQLLERQERLQPALDHLLLAWALAARERAWEQAAEKARQQVEEFLARHAQALGASAVPLTPPDPAPLVAACRKLWCDAAPAASGR